MPDGTNRGNESEEIVKELKKRLEKLEAEFHALQRRVEDVVKTSQQKPS
jgi:hypothetical protein